MSREATYWINRDLMVRMADAKVDTVVFDVDGVLLDDKASFRAAVISTVAHLTAHLNSPGVTLDEVAAFKKAGGLNNDWDLAYVLVALVTARYRDQADAEWPTLSALAAESQGGGVEWVKSRVPDDALPDYEVVKQVVNEFYWGTDLVRERLGLVPRHLKSHRGYVLDEPALIPAGFLDDMKRRGIEHFGIITGRTRAELAMGLEVLRLDGSFGCVVPAEEGAKPDPALLWRMVEFFDPNCMIYVGDTRDDFELVRRYRATASSGAPPALSVIVAPMADWGYWQGLGVDVVVSETRVLLDVLDALS